MKKKQWRLDSKDSEKKVISPHVEMLTMGNERFQVKYAKYKSADGVEIPLRITFKEGMKLDGNNPTLMEVYGGFKSNHYFHPYFDKMTQEFIIAGGVHVAPAVRGSYFYGKPWHLDGAGYNKQNSINDFIAAAEWLIAQKITSPGRLATRGASHGGLVVAAAMVKRPDLFGFVMPQFGAYVFDDKPTLDPFTTPTQTTEYGDLIKDELAQAFAKAISPNRNAQEKKVFPLVYLVTGRLDSRVNPDHSIQFFKTLKENQIGDQPIFLYTLPNAGHFMTSPRYQSEIGLRAKTTVWAALFTFFDLKLKDQDPEPTASIE